MPSRTKQSRGARPTIAPTPDPHVQQLEREVARCQAVVDASTASPTIWKKKPREEFLTGTSPGSESMFRSEKNPPSGNKDRFQVPRGRKVIYQRLANNWFLCEPGTTRLVCPEFHPADGIEESPAYDLYAVVNPGNDGARRLTMTYGGQTPLGRASHPDVWQLQTRFLKVAVHSPCFGYFSFHGCLLPNIVFHTAFGEDVSYIPQNPDKAYLPYYELMLATWQLRSAQGKGQALVRWQDFDVAGPRPWFANKWATQVMRLEIGVPKDHADDPDRLAMLGLCRSRVQGRRAPTTEAQWERLEGEPGDDEANLSDAGSISDDVERGLPTSSSWDPLTKRSTSSQS